MRMSVLQACYFTIKMIKSLSRLLFVVFCLSASVDASQLLLFGVGGTGTRLFYLSDLTEDQAFNGYGVLKKNTSTSDATITIGGNTYAKGLGVHARSMVQYTLNSACQSLQAVIGVDDEISSGGSVRFFVLGDTHNTLYDSGRLTSASSALSITVDIRGVNVIQLVVTDATDSIDSDHGDWGDLKVRCRSTPVTNPYSYVEINPGDDIGSIISGAPSPSHFLLKSGLHRIRDFTYSGFFPRSNDTFTGEWDTVIDGSIVLTGFTEITNALGPVWYVGGFTDEIYDTNSSNCLSGYRCNHAEDVFFDGVRMHAVETFDEITTDSFWNDYDNDLVIIGNDPSGHTVEVAAATWFFDQATTAANVQVHGLVFQKFANPAQKGLIAVKNAHGWIVEDNTFRLNHGYGLSIAPEMQIRRNYFAHNGHLGVGGGPDTEDLDDIIVEDNEMQSNTEAGFDPNWEGGGTKFTLTTNLVVRRNFVRSNFGVGLWTDIDNQNSLIEYNVVVDNTYVGIFHEISDSAIIRYNSAGSNGSYQDSGLQGACILVSASRDVEVYGNKCYTNRDGIGALQQERGDSDKFSYRHVVQNVHFYDNDVQVDDSISGFDGNSSWSGLLVQVADDHTPFYTSMGNSFENNRYYVVSTSDPVFTWDDLGNITFTAWQSYGNDTPTGSIQTGSIP